MENKINTKIVITVSKNKKLLSCLRKLDSGEAASVNVEINYAYKKKPIKLSFLEIKTPTKTSDDFLVYAEYRSSKSSSKVVLGNASIKNIQETGFVSIGNKEAKECVVINTYSKDDSPDFRELKKVLLDMMELKTYPLSNCTPHKDISNSTILIELKPENSKIISYEVSVVPAVKTGKVRKHSVNPPVSQDDSSLKEDTNSSTENRRLTTIASFVFSHDAHKYAKKLNKILTVGEIDIKADCLTKVGKISSFKLRIDAKSNNYSVVAISELDEQITMDCYNRHKSSQFAIGILFGYQHYIGNIIIGAISRRLFEVKQNKIARRNLSRALETATGDIPTRKLYMAEEEKSPLKSEFTVEHTVEHKEKSPISDCFPKMSIDATNNKIKTELVSFSCSVPSNFIQRIILEDNYSIDTVNLSASFEIGNKVFNGAVVNGTIVRASIDTDSKIVGFLLSSHISTMVSLEILIDNDSKKIIQNLLDSTDLETAAVGKLMLRTTINDNINYEFTDIHKSLQQIGVIWANKHALLNNKHSSSDKVDNSDKYIHTGSLCNCGFCTIERNKPTEAVEDNKNIDVELIVDTYSHEDVEKLNSRVNPPYKIDGKAMDIISVSESKFTILSIAKGLANMMKKEKKRVDCSKPSIKINIKSKCGYSNRNISVENIAIMYDHTNSKYYIVGVLSNEKIDSLIENKDNCINVLADGREEAKDVVNQLFKEINKSKYFPKTLTKDEDCLLSYSERLDKILEYRSKIETLMLIKGSVKVKLFKDLDVIKTFNISRVGIYYSNANKEYVLVGIK